MIQDEDSTGKVISENLVQFRAKYFVNSSRAVSTIFRESQVNNMAADALIFNYVCQRNVDKWLTMNEKMFPHINSLCENEIRVSHNRSWLASCVMFVTWLVRDHRAAIILKTKINTLIKWQWTHLTDVLLGSDPKEASDQEFHPAAWHRCRKLNNKKIKWKRKDRHQRLKLQVDNTFYWSISFEINRNLWNNKKSRCLCAIHHRWKNKDAACITKWVNFQERVNS